MKTFLVLFLSAIIGSFAFADSGPATQVFKYNFQYPGSEVTSFNLVYADGTAYEHGPYNSSIDTIVTLCDLDVRLKSTFGKTINCMVLGTNGYSSAGYVVFFKGKLMKVKDGIDSAAYLLQTAELPQPSYPEFDSAQVKRFKSIFLGVSPARPISFVFNMETGAWSYGFSLSRLLPFE